MLFLLLPAVFRIWGGLYLMAKFILVLEETRYNTEVFAVEEWYG